MSGRSERQKRHLSQAIRLEEVTNPALVRLTMVIITGLILSFLAWSAVTYINEVARTPGEVVPKGEQKVVQHLEGGIVRELLVREGDTVRKNDLLMVLDGAGTEDDLNRALSKKTALHLQEERLRAFIENRKPDFSAYTASGDAQVKDQSMFFEGMVKAREEERGVIEEQIVQKRRMLAVLQSDLKTAQENHAITLDLYKRREALNRKGYVSDVQYLETKQRLNDIAGTIQQSQNRISVTRSEIMEFENRLKSLEARHMDQVYERLDQVLADAQQNDEVIDKIRNRVERLEVRAPSDGRIKGLAFNTIGAVVKPGQTIAEVVPDGDTLVVYVKIPPQHIGHIRTGQAVSVKFSTFDFARYGAVPGTLEQISPTTFSGENGERYYEGRISLEKDYVGHNKDNHVMPGMTVMADIVTGEKTLLDYLLKPIQIAAQTSFSER